MGEKIFQSDSGPSVSGNAAKKRMMPLNHTTIGLVTEGQAVEGLKKRIADLESRLTVQGLEVKEYRVIFLCILSLILTFYSQGESMNKANEALEAAERRKSGLKSSPVTFSELEGSSPGTSTDNDNEMNPEQISHE